MPSFQTSLLGQRASRGRFIVITLMLVGSVLAAAATAHTPRAHGATATDSCHRADQAPHKLTRSQARAACLIDRRRTASRLGTLSQRSEAKRAATAHARHMQRTGCFAHQCPGEPDVTGRMLSTAYLPCEARWSLSETIAWGKRKRGTPKAIVKGWMASPVHRQTILNGAFEHIGVGVVRGRPRSPTRKSATYTVVLGSKRY